DALMAPPSAAVLPEPVSEAPDRAPTDAAAPTPFANQPRAELRRPGPRARLVSAARDTSATFDAPVTIDGRPVRTTGTIVSVDPGHVATPVCRAGHASAAEAERPLEPARRALPAWRAPPRPRRAATPLRGAAIVRRR